MKYKIRKRQGRWEMVNPNGFVIGARSSWSEAMHDTHLHLALLAAMQDAVNRLHDKVRRMGVW